VSFLHDLSEPTKRFLDVTAIAGAVTAITLSQVALIVSIIAGILSAAWMCQRFYDRHFLNRPSDD
jgi:hypothetical protein